MISLAGKVAVITGASRGIGAATAQVLASSGAKVALLARTSSEIQALAAVLEAQGHEALALTCDVSQYASVASATQAVMQAWGQIDILINNAGIIEPIGHLTDVDPLEWAQVIDVNVKGVAFCLHAVLPIMEAQGSGTVVNVSSGAATAAIEGWAHYCASKAAVLALTRCMQAEYGPKGVTVVGMSPGTVATDMQVVIKASGINAISKLDPSVHIPPVWAAKAIAWLCGPEGAEFAGQDFALRPEETKRRLGLID